LDFSSNVGHGLLSFLTALAAGTDPSATLNEKRGANEWDGASNSVLGFLTMVSNRDGGAAAASRRTRTRPREPLLPPPSSRPGSPGRRRGPAAAKTAAIRPTGSVRRGC